MQMRQGLARIGNLDPKRVDVAALRFWLAELFPHLDRVVPGFGVDPAFGQIPKRFRLFPMVGIGDHASAR